MTVKYMCDICDRLYNRKEHINDMALSAGGYDLAVWDVCGAHVPESDEEQDKLTEDICEAIEEVLEDTEGEEAIADG